MAVTRFTKNVKSVVARTPRPPVVPLNDNGDGKRKPWATVEKNGKTGFIMHLGRPTTAAFGLEPGDKIFLQFDDETHELSFRKHVKGNLTLVMHGGNPKRLKVSISEFYREVLSPYDLPLPLKGNVTKGAGGWVSFPVLIVKPKRAARVKVAPVVEVPAPVVEKKSRRKAATA